MSIKQISVFVENQSGRLAEIAETLGNKGINILALSIADTTDFGILRMITDDADSAEECLRESGMTVRTTDVLAIAVEHAPGGLSKALIALHDAGIAIEYMYAFTGYSAEKKGSMLILRVDQQEKAMDVLKKTGIDMLSAEEVKKL